MKLSEFILSKPYHYKQWMHDTITLPAGTFVKPIHTVYVPKHVREAENNLFFNPSLELFVYCKLGIIVVPKDIVREIK